MKRPDLILLVAVWEFLSAFLALIGVAAILLIAFPTVINDFRFGFDRTGYVGAMFGMSIGIIVIGIYLAVSVIGGIGLLRVREWGRIVSIVQAVLSLFNVPFGTVAGVLILIYLTRTEVRNYFAGVAVPPVMPPPAPPAPPSQPMP